MMLSTMSRPMSRPTVRETAPMLTFVHPLLGFPDQTEYDLVRIDEEGPLSRLQSAHSERAQFLVVPAATFFPSYAPTVGDDVVDDLGIESADDVLVLLIVHAAETLAATTVNLRAPVLVNTANRRAAQVILDDADLPVAAPLLG